MNSGDCFVMVYDIKKSVICLTQKDMCPWNTQPGYVYDNITVGNTYEVSWSDTHPDLYMFVDDKGKLGIVHKNNFRDATREIRKKKLQKINAL